MFKFEFFSKFKKIHMYKMFHKFEEINFLIFEIEK
jgi:hypothetical protein